MKKFFASAAVAIAAFSFGATTTASALANPALAGAPLWHERILAAVRRRPGACLCVGGAPAAQEPIDGTASARPMACAA